MNNGQQMESKKDQTEKILRLLTKRGFIGDEDINDEKIRSAQRERQKVAYHNTELLLKQYKNGNARSKSGYRIRTGRGDGKETRQAQEEKRCTE